MKFLVALLRALSALFQKRHARKAYIGGVMALAGVSVYVGATNVPTQSAAAAPSGALSWDPDIVCPLVNPTVVNVPPTGISGVTYGASEDVLFIMPNQPVIPTGTNNALGFTGGRNKQIIGGVIEDTRTTTTQKYGILNRSSRGNVCIEGVKIDQSRARDADAIVVDGLATCGVSRVGWTYPNLYVQNSVLLGSDWSGGSVHPDLIQKQGPMGGVYVERVTGRTEYQGFQISPTSDCAGGSEHYVEAPNDGITLKDVDIDTYGEERGGFLLWLGWMAGWNVNFPGAEDPEPMSLDNVWVEGKAADTLAQDLVLPRSNSVGQGSEDIALDVASNGLTGTWRSAAGITGTINRGDPPYKDMVGEDEVGLGYVTPGYVTDGAGPTTFNAFVASGGGSCTRASTAIAYTDIGTNGVDEVCGSFDQAFDAMNSGDVGQVQAGTYAAQSLTGDKTSLTRLIGAGDGDDVIVSTVVSGAVSGFQDFSWCAICIDSNYVSIENLTTLTDDPGPFGSVGIWGSNDRLVDVDNLGAVSNDPDTGDFYASSIGVNGPNFTYLGGSIGRDTPETTTCDNATIEPIWMQSGSAGSTIDGVTVGEYIPLNRAGGSCGGDNTPHIETVRLDDADNITIKNSYFRALDDGGSHGSGHIFTSSDSDNFTLLNTRLGLRPNGDTTIATTGSTASGWVIAYNTFGDDRGASLPSGTVVVGNYGNSIGCGASNLKNVWDGSGSCGTDTHVGATDLQLNDDLLLESGSAPAVNAAETPGASDYCTDAATVNSVDYEGDARSGVCDAGADEF
jgi:hypothetical protein